MPGATYELAFESTGARSRALGAELMQQFALSIPTKHRSELITYQRWRE
jgi:hypothetical protein